MAELFQLQAYRNYMKSWIAIFFFVSLFKQVNGLPICMGDLTGLVDIEKVVYK